MKQFLRSELLSNLRIISEQVCYLNFVVKFYEM